ncbi:MAG: acyltransferase [Fibrobacterales bacterium]
MNGVQSMMGLLIKTCRRSQTSLSLLLMRTLYYKLFYGITVLLHQKVTLRGAQNITTEGRFEVAVRYRGFQLKQDRTLLNIEGSLDTKNDASVGRGCRIDVAKGGTMTLGLGSYINCYSLITIQHALTIGDGCAIGWHCTILDDDLHELSYESKVSRDPVIAIGDQVWIGCGVKIYKGTILPEGTVVAADSVVRGVFTQKNTLIAGNPARVIKEKVSWS